jgi:hypothetical protein
VNTYKFIPYLENVKLRKNAVVAQLSKLAILFIIFRNQAVSLGYF